MIRSFTTGTYWLILIIITRPALMIWMESRPGTDHYFWLIHVNNWWFFQYQVAVVTDCGPGACWQFSLRFGWNHNKSNSGSGPLTWGWDCYDQSNSQSNVVYGLRTLNGVAQLSQFDADNFGDSHNYTRSNWHKVLMETGFRGYHHLLMAPVKICYLPEYI